MPGRAAIAFIRVYKRYVSSLLPSSCRFTPTCSQYTIDAIVKYGFLRGIAKGVWRVMRCQPFSKGGSDPVK